MPEAGATTTAGRAASSERRPLTVLFTDIVGSTAIAEKLDPEDWTAIVGQAFGVMNATVRRYDGTIARLMGDGLLAFFGAPVAHEDDPERAIRCGLDLVAAIDTLCVQVRKSHGIELRVRVGINTGPVVVGMVGSDAANEYTAMGDAVNVAARMQAAARPGAVLVTEATYYFVAPLVNATDVGALELKGKTEPVRGYEVTGFRTGVTTTRGLAGIRSPMVGRDAELARLQGAFRIAQAKQGRVACILGEPGLGKSRLLAELRASIEATDPTAQWLEGRCLSYGRTMPYHLVVDLVHSILGLGAGSDEPQLRAALQARLHADLGESWEDAYAYLGHLLSLKLEPAQQARISSLDGETTKRYIAALSLLLRALAAKGPLVIVCEDLHWADAASVDALLTLLPLTSDMQVLFIATSRLDRDSEGWRMITSVRDLVGDALVEIRLEPLSGDESRALVANLLKIESLAPVTRDLILDRAEGNPFFVEEVIRMLIDRGLIVRDGDRWVATSAVADVEIPDTLQGLLLARIDRLPAETRRTLRVASVIGRQFGVTILERLLEGPTA